MEQTFDEFINYCYNRILDRIPDPGGKEHYIKLLNKGVPKHEILISLLNSDEYAERIKYLMSPTIKFAPPGHFYSPLPDIDGISKLYQKIDKSRNPIGIDINGDKQIELLKQFKKYISAVPFGDGFRKNNNRYFFNGDEWYSYGDAIILFCMINHFKPKRLVEVGSGYSSIVTLDTCEFSNLETKITFIEPYPDLILSLLSDRDDPEKLILRKKVQNINLSLFEDLNSGDILFVDSSHVVKFASDVLFIISEVLPRLKSGVIIHFHDIFWPFEYPFEWLERGFAWNEAYFLKALLLNNNNYEILYFNDYMGQIHHDLVKQYMPLALKNCGCGIWLKKT
ncbi:hypothetical protein MSLAZ_2496 [Methanosarcina lacustris Z-7289]|uniref:DUF4214 domain-containing protein n=1 Tax=Methanosarcina lacustris Z-7289 TaxID=1434111 RepID=A0A0E3S8D8_9EURY|nr:class I SAM-dependent methyltransferase [Methanosarcina lacustris]AKB75757.1 hypothetical protein MSLAZ_2496 [Methanosarcina lacustris Z-7289]